MRLSGLCADDRGASAVEFALTAPVFLALLIGALEGGLLLWTQLGLQHGAEMAARCATVSPARCGSTSAIQGYAANQAFGLNPPPTTFSFVATACGNQVSASYTFQFLTSYFPVATLTVTAQSCFPK